MTSFNVNQNELKTRVLVVEDSRPLNFFYNAVVKGLNTEVRSAYTGREAIELLDTFAPDIVLLDLNLPDIPGMEILSMLGQQYHQVITIVITADERANLPAEAMRLGAYDFLVKPVDSNRLRTTINNTIEKLELDAKVNGEPDSSIHLGNFIGASKVMRDIYDKLCRIRNSKASVFITGESGTGKEVTANTLHELNTERKGKFMAINCAAIPKEIMESTIFGHVKGAFTGAVADRTGAVAEADGGTLFLDEICEMDLELQSKLLRFLQSSKYRMVGSQKTLSVDVRVICATNRDPFNEVKLGNFREDLFYRLFVIPIHLPPLREREHDVLHIAMHFLKKYAELEHKDFLYISHEASEIMLKYPWPGNVRELQNVIHSTVVLFEGPVITGEMLPANILKAVEDIEKNPEHYQKYVGRNSRFLIDGSDAVMPPALGAPSVTAPQPVPAENMVPGSRAPEENRAEKSEPAGSAVPEASADADDSSSPGLTVSPAGMINLPVKEDEIQTLEDVKRIYTVAAINACNGSVALASKLLGINVTTLYRQMEKWKEDGFIEKCSVFMKPAKRGRRPSKQS
ncbi:sigma 54-interacting transcriptional regulator [Ruminobacter amylophilus]|uniref:sigma 54-interacting transcriptional regulator n=1 Tax=Ruminobacter amylophilus TaxID=867 RepID=UPI00386F98F2